MKRMTTLLALFAFCFTLVAGAHANPEDPVNPKAKTTQAQWDAFSRNLTTALQSEHEGVKLAALQQVIHYGDKVDVDQAAIDVMRLYRDHQDDDVRRLAVVALGKMQSRWAMGYLERSEDFEKSDDVRQTIRAVVSAYHAEKGDA